jgi:hypothetical protein
MNKRVLAAVAAAVLALPALMLASAGNQAEPVPAVSSELPPLLVDDLLDFDGVGNQVKVIGFVGGTNEGQGMFGLVDPREVEACGTVTCPRFLLPVSWDGEMPGIGLELLVSGTVRRADEGLVLVASGVEAR